MTPVYVMGQEVANFFARASESGDDVTKGAKNFKRKVLGLCGTTSVKSLDEIIRILCDSNITSSIEEARVLLPSLIDKRIRYSREKEIAFSDEGRIKGIQSYQIYVIVNDIWSDLSYKKTINSS